MKPLVIALLFLAAPAQVHATTCPLLWLECLPDTVSTTDVARFERTGAAWEVQSWRAIRSGAIGKHPMDVLEYGEGRVDLGILHLRYGGDDMDVLGIGIDRNDPDSLAWVLSALYYDRADLDYSIQITEWRRRTGPAIREARRNGCRRGCLSVVGALANSSPVIARRIGRAARWEPAKMCEMYATSEHRRRRADWLLTEVL